jgi:LysR family transcriptional regulator, hydrogen peroxide-inducible genes activator
LALPSLKQLQYLVALYEHKSFTRAADACGVTQSTLSSSLKELEATLGMRLVERAHRVVEFTPIGMAVKQRAEQLLLQAQELSQLAPAPLSGTLRLSVIPTVAPFLLPRFLVGVCQAHPALKFDIREEMSHEGCAGLSNGTRDCMILALPYECGDFEYATLFEDPILVAARRDDPVAMAASISPQDLPEDGLLVLHEGHCLRDHALKACSRPGSAARSTGAASIPTLIQLVNARLGVALIPRLAIEAGVTAGTDVVTRPLAGRDARRVVAMAWRPRNPRAADFAALASDIARASNSSAHRARASTKSIDL